MRRLCEKAPEATRSLANTIPEYSDTNGSTRDVARGPLESLVSEEECRELMATFALDAVSYLYEMERNSRVDADISGIGGDTEGVLECCC